MAVLEALSDEECYLYAIICDESGIDLAEFTWTDAMENDNCFRAWAFQWPWWRTRHPQQIDQCARSIGKSLGVKVRAYAFPLNFPGQEMVITGPEGIHVDAITDLIETQFLATRFGRYMLAGGRSQIKHRPFHMNFANGARIMGRIPQRDGKGVKGVHPVQLELDEAQDYPKAGWTELVETLKHGIEGATWRAHGVTRGVRDEFFKFTQDNPDNEWHVHRITAMHRPTWSDEERHQKIKQYGSRDDPDYRRNVLGKHGDATNPLFVLHRLMRCVDVDETSPFNLGEYYQCDVKDSELEYLGIDVVDFLDLEARCDQHKRMYQKFWIGMDVGYTSDPSEILVFAEYHPSQAELKIDKSFERAIPDEGKSRLKCIARFTLKRLSSPLQVRVIMKLIDFYEPAVFAMDKTGNGLPLFQSVQDEIEKTQGEDSRLAMDRARRIKGYNFSEKVLVDIDDTVELPETADVDQTVDEAGIKRNVLEHSTDALRTLVDEARLLLPWDRELIGEFQGQTFVYSKATMDAYGRRRRIFSEGRFHALDAARMAVMGWTQHSIEEFTRKDVDNQEVVLDMFVSL